MLVIITISLCQWVHLTETLKQIQNKMSNFMMHVKENSGTILKLMRSDVYIIKYIASSIDIDDRILIILTVSNNKWC